MDRQTEEGFELLGCLTAAAVAWLLLVGVGLATALVWLLRKL